MVGSWFRRGGAVAQPTGRQRCANFRPQLEALENRTLLNAGGLDPRFGMGGEADIPFPTPLGPPSAASASAIAIQGDKSVLAGTDFNVASFESDFAVTRLNSDGSLDNTFGTAGKATVDFGGLDVAYAVAIQGNKIVVAGFSANDNGQQLMAVARLNNNGSLDSTFGTGGEVLIDFSGSDSAMGVAVEGSKIVVVGTTFMPTGEDAAVARLNYNGSLDGSFGTGGKVMLAFGQNTYNAAYAVAIQGDRTVVAGGASSGQSSQFAVARLLNNGSLDSRFGIGGETTFLVGEGGPANAVALAGTKIVLAGTVAEQNGNANAFGVAELNWNGTLNTRFGTGGTVTFNFTANNQDFANGIAVQGDKIVVAGFTQTPDGQSNVAVARLTYDGSLDSSFGTGGEVVTQFGQDEALGFGVAIRGCDIVVAGVLVNQSTGANDFLAVAYLNY